MTVGALAIEDRLLVGGRGRTVVEAGDRLYVLATSEVGTQVEWLLEQWRRGPMPVPLRPVREEELGPGELAEPGGQA